MIRTSVFATALIGCLAAGAAHAGTCPTDKLVASGSGQPRSPLPASGVTDTVIVSTDLAKENVNIHDRLFRLRKLVIQPGGVVPIVHKAGESISESHATAHWWKNKGKVPGVLISADLFHKTKGDEHMM